jgi:long-subunit fatty acid transport protein
MTISVDRLTGHSGVLILLLAASLAPAGVAGQEAAAPLQFSYSDPGARSMGFGGAFVALADDATAAFANPAGLVQLLRPEVSIEARGWNYSTPYTVGGRTEGLPSGIGIDTTAGLRMATSEDDITGISYLSFVYPKENWSFAVYRHQLANFEFFSETQGLFSGGTDCCQVREFDQRVVIDMDIVSYGLAAAYRINDKFSLGLGVIYYDTLFVSDATTFRTDDDSGASLLGLNSYLPERSLLNERLTFDDNDWAVTGGFLWSLSESWSIGGVYRQAPEVDFGVELTAGQALDPGILPGELLFRGSIGLELPDFYGLGLAYRSPDGGLTLSFQWDRVEYSSIVDSLGLTDRAIDDGNELHLGGEYVFLGSTPIIAVRLGAWLETDHLLRASIDESLDRALLPPGDDEMHYAAGLGVAMERFQIDLAADFSDGVDTVSLSAIYNF